MENTACAAEHTPGEQPGEKTYAVLTEALTKELAGWSCEMMKTDLEVKREQAMKDLDRGWLPDWGDMLALTCIVLCLLESATRALPKGYTYIKQPILNSYK